MTDLTAICDTCLNTIPAGEGHVWVDQDLAHKVTRRHQGDTIPWPDSTGVEDITSPDHGVRWHVTHTACEPRMPEWAYAIPVERISTWPSFLHWTAHLMHKGWLEVTDWDDLVLRALEPHRSTPSGLRPNRPQDLDFRGIGS